MADIPLPCLCLVTDRYQCVNRPLEEVVAQAVKSGAGMVQLREKDLPAGQLLALARRLRHITLGKALLFVNDRIDVALACEADGVQLGEEGLPLDAARGVAGERLILGRSVHSVEGARTAEAEGADLLTVGTIFRTQTHPGADVAGVGLLERVRDAVDIPFLAIGGVDSTNIDKVMGSGASGAAVITAITRSADPEAATTELAEKMKGSWVNASISVLERPA